MKKLFKGYYQPSQQDFKKLWEEALFVFDTNVLLNLYRYQPKAKNQLLSLMGKLSKRIWIPHHVALEYQRNRPYVIAEQHRKYNEVRKVVQSFPNDIELSLSKLNIKKRHSHIDTDVLTKKIEELVTGFVSDLNKLEEKSLQLTAEDEIRSKLDLLFENSVGDPPTNQKWLDDLHKEGEGRYKISFPPGCKDDDKDDDCFSYGGLDYKNKYGDLILWKQLIEHVSKSKIKSIIFVTDDGKSDWWNIIQGKTLGPRPELIEEAQRLGGVEKFHVYSTKSFLEHSNTYVGAKVGEDTITEVSEVASRRNQMFHERYRARRYHERLSNELIHIWLEKHFDRVVNDRIGFPDFVCYQNGQKYGFITKFVSEPKILHRRLDDSIYKAYHALHELDYTRINMMLILESEDLLDEVTNIVERKKT